jgi:hypothetical protein
MPVQARVTINDNETPPSAGSIQFSQASFDIAENGAFATLTLTRTGGTAGIVDVRYRTRDNASATAGSDYTAGTGTLVFADGAANGVIFIDISDDNLDELNENFLVELYEPSGGAVLGALATATVNIIDDDVSGVLSFTDSILRIVRGETTVEFTVLRQAGADGSVSVEIAATAGPVTETVATVDFADGQLSADVTLTFDAAISPALESEIDQLNQLTLALRSPTGGAALGDPKILTVEFASPPSGGGGGSGGGNILFLFLLAVCYRLSRSLKARLQARSK